MGRRGGVACMGGAYIRSHEGLGPCHCLLLVKGGGIGGCGRVAGVSFILLPAIPLRACCTACGICTHLLYCLRYHSVAATQVQQCNVGVTLLPGFFSLLPLMHV